MTESTGQCSSDFPGSDPPPTSSVVIAAYNSAHLLGRTLDSIGAQTVPPDEVIVVDDGSRDETAAIAEAHPAATRVVSQSNGGMCHARNTGIELSTGELIFIVDSDDLWHPEYVERMVRMMVDHPGASMGFARYLPWQHPVEEPAPFEDRLEETVRLHDLESYTSLMLAGLPVLPSFHVARREALLRLGDRPYREQQIQGEAAYMFALLATMGSVVEHVAPLGRYRMHANAVTGDEIDAAIRVEPCIDDLRAAAHGGLGLGLELDTARRRIIDRHAADWYRRCGRRLGGGGKRASGRRQFLKAARIGDLRAAAFWAASFVPGLSRRVWMNGWRPETVRREAGTEAWSLPDR